MLNDLKIFRILRDGDGESDKLKKLWGSNFKYSFLDFGKEKAEKKEREVGEEAPKDDENKKKERKELPKENLCKEVLDVFEFILVTSLGRSLKPQEQAEKIKLKETKATIMPTLERISSVVDVDVTLQMLSQGFDIVFKELSRFTKELKDFAGLNWKIYVRLMNRYRKIGTYFKDEVDDNSGVLAFGLNTGVEIVPESDPYANEYNDYDDDYNYEGGEPSFEDPDVRHARMEKMKEE